MPELISPTVRLHASWLQSLQEWGRGVHQDGTGLHSDDEVDTAEGFAAWLERLSQQNDPTIPLPEGRVPAEYWWIVDGDTYLGAITLRHELNDFLMEQGGHIGYGVRPSARRRGLATWALGEVLQRARRLGLARCSSPATTTTWPQRGPSNGTAVDSRTCASSTTTWPCAGTGSTSADVRAQAVRPWRPAGRDAHRDRGGA